MNRVVKITLSDKIAEKLEADAEEFGLSLAAYIRVVLAQKVMSDLSDKYKKVD